MRVSDLFIYPVKSLGGIRVSEARVLQRGFEHDRRLMLVDENGKFITQRVEHKLALLQSALTDGNIFIYYKKDHSYSLTIDLKTASTLRKTVRVWDDDVEAVLFDEQINNWFSDFLGKPCALVYMPDESERQIDRKYAVNHEKVSFADAFPYLLIGSGSFNDLNSRLKQPVPMNRFRPSIVIEGLKAFEEDEWSEIQIGVVRFKVAKPCARCILTTVDQDSGTSGKEPLATLSTYRKTDNKIMFGQNLIALNEGLISEGDELKIITRKG